MGLRIDSPNRRELSRNVRMQCDKYATNIRPFRDLIARNKTDKNSHERRETLARMSHDCRETLARIFHDCRETLARMSHSREMLARMSHDCRETLARMSHDCRASVINIIGYMSRSQSPV